MWNTISTTKIRLDILWMRNQSGRPIPKKSNSVKTPRPPRYPYPSGRICHRTKPDAVDTRNEKKDRTLTKRFNVFRFICDLSYYLTGPIGKTVLPYTSFSTWAHAAYMAVKPQKIPS